MKKGRPRVEWEKTFPELLKHWDFNKNEKLIEDCHFNSVVWWTCEKGHSYCERIGKAIVRKKKGCRICNVPVKQLWEKNNLAHNHPELMKEWDFEKNLDLNPCDILPGAKLKVWWKCKKGHSFLQGIGERTNIKRKNGCPYCSHNKPSVDNNLGLHDTAKEFHPTKNFPLTPQDIMPHSNKKIWWLCSKGHEHEMQVSRKTKGGGCPQCFHRTSKIELQIFSELNKFFGNVIRGKRISGWELDIYLEDLGIGVEVDGWYFHKDKVERDLNKNKVFSENNITLIRLREFPLNILSPMDISCIIDYNNPDALTIVKNLMLQISKISGKDVSQYLSDNHLIAQEEYLKLLKNPNTNILEKHPHLLEWWHPTKNGNLKLEHFALNSNQKVWWLCPKEKHEFLSKVINRVKGCGCPLCDSRTRGHYLKHNQP